MEIKSQWDLIEPFRNSGGAAPKHGDLWTMALDEILRNFPVAASRCNAVNYDTKTDRYVGTFSIGNDTSKVKLTNAVAKFRLANMTVRTKEGHVAVAQAYLRLDDDGACDDVLLVTL